MPTSVDLDHIPFVQAKWYHHVVGRKPRVIVIHTMEAPEKGTTAESVAKYFQNLTRPASAHYCIDNNSIVKCVATGDVAFGCPGLNRIGIHLEHAGYARQSVKEWHDQFSLDMLDISAKLAAKLCDVYGISRRWLIDDDLRNIKSGEAIASGITTHADASRVFKTPGGHTDPGPNFPKVEYLDKVIQYYKVV